jgi:hypothetical protein
MEAATTRTADASAIQAGKAEHVPCERVHVIAPLTGYVFKVYASAMKDLAAIIAKFLHALVHVLAMECAMKQHKNVTAPHGSPGTTAQPLCAHSHVLGMGTV